MSKITDLKVGDAFKQKAGYNAWIIRVSKDGKYLADTGVRVFEISIKDITEVTFTLEAAITIQDQQLEEWKAILIPEVYQELYKAAKLSNIGRLNPYAIVRGQELTNWIENYKLGVDYRPF